MTAPRSKARPPAFLSTRRSSAEGSSMARSTFRSPSRSAAARSPPGAILEPAWKPPLPSFQEAWTKPLRSSLTKSGAPSSSRSAVATISPGLGYVLPLENLAPPWLIRTAARSSLFPPPSTRRSNPPVTVEVEGKNLARKLDRRGELTPLQQGADRVVHEDDGRAAERLRTGQVRIAVAVEVPGGEGHERGRGRAIEVEQLALLEGAVPA